MNRNERQWLIKRLKKGIKSKNLNKFARHIMEVQLAYLKNPASNRCILCGGRVGLLAMFRDFGGWGASGLQGSDRTIVYGLCNDCASRPDSFINAERVAKYTAQQNDDQLPRYGSEWCCFVCESKEAPDSFNLGISADQGYIRGVFHICETCQSLENTIALVGAVIDRHTLRAAVNQ